MAASGFWSYYSRNNADFLMVVQFTVLIWDLIVVQQIIKTS
jgi:hypothetical protein